MTRYGLSVLALTLGVPGLAAAQGAAMAAVAPAPTRQGGGGMVVTGPVETKITPGRPYSADAVTERTQILGDGNRIEVRSTTRIYRDGEGRIRRETYTGDGTLRSVSISDPVARVSYTLDPVKKIAYRSGNVMAPAVAPAVAPAAVSGGGGGRGGAVITRTQARDDPNTRKEDLGSQSIEGVMATGSRTTTVVPAGQIGNAQEIRVISEQWFSDDLQVLVMTRHSDPRSGENTYRLRNIVRAEPDPSLFAPPADYTVQDRGVRRPQ